MKIAICDDDKGSVRSLKNIIMEIADRGRREVEIQSYFAVDKFEKAVRGGRIMILFIWILSSRRSTDFRRLIFCAMK